MRSALALIVGITIGFVIAHLNVGIPAQAQSPDGQYQMFVTSGSSGGPFGFLLNIRTGALKFCNARVEQGRNVSQCFPVPGSIP
jgi:hypothetical protein